MNQDIIKHLYEKIDNRIKRDELVFGDCFIKLTYDKNNLLLKIEFVTQRMIKG